MQVSNMNGITRETENGEFCKERLHASAGNHTLVNCLEGSYDNHYTMALTCVKHRTFTQRNIYIKPVSITRKAFRLVIEADPSVNNLLLTKIAKQYKQEI